MLASFLGPRIFLIHLKSARPHQSTLLISQLPTCTYSRHLASSVKIGKLSKEKERDKARNGKIRKEFNNNIFAPASKIISTTNQSDGDGVFTERVHQNEKEDNSAANHAASHYDESKKIVRMALAGNMVITCAKTAAWISTGSSAMLSEAIHSLVDSGNQALLLVGLTGAGSKPDKSYTYGYGKSIYFWSLVSALGTFWCGAGVSCWSSMGSLINPVVDTHAMMGWEMWSVLGCSFVVDGWIFGKTLLKLNESKPKDISLLTHFKRLKDPTTAAVLMEDGAACAGVLIAIAGIGATALTHSPVFDGIAGLAISGLLASMGVYLANLNMKYLLGHAVDPEITADIKKILLSRPSIEEVHSEQSQYIGPYAFSYKAEVDFDGTFLAAKLMRRYQQEFQNVKNLSPDEIKLLLAWYAEDVMRTVEQEVKDVEIEIKQKYPTAMFIELEPDGKKMSTMAIDDGRELSLRRVEIDTINQLEDDLDESNEHGTQGKRMNSKDWMKDDLMP